MSPEIQILVVFAVFLGLLTIGNGAVTPSTPVPELDITVIPAVPGSTVALLGAAWCIGRRRRP